MLFCRHSPNSRIQLIVEAGPEVAKMPLDSLQMGQDKLPEIMFSVSMYAFISLFYHSEMFLNVYFSSEKLLF